MRNFVSEIKLCVIVSLQNNEKGFMIVIQFQSYADLNILDYIIIIVKAIRHVYFIFLHIKKIAFH